MALPNFLIIIGAQKAGTTWLAYQLRQHPDVFMPSREVHFFDSAGNFEKGLAWYEGHFEDARGKRVIGEKTPEYCWVGGRGPGHLPEVHRNIHAALPEVRLIMILRNPVDRAVSHLTHLIRAGQVGPLERVDDLLVGRRRQLVTDIGVIDRGRYVYQIAAFRELFDPRQLLVLVYEEDGSRAAPDGPREGLPVSRDRLLSSRARSGPETKRRGPHAPPAHSRLLRPAAPAPQLATRSMVQAVEGVSRRERDAR
ncbi:MAG: sulfotransferase family protein, partial [Gemmatimonadales bacterium]